MAVGSGSDPALQVLPLPGRGGLRVIGEVDTSTRDGWEGALSALLASNTPPELDLSEVSFIDVRGTAALVAAAQQMAPKRTLTLYGPPPCLRRILDLLWPGVLPAISIADREAG